MPAQVGDICGKPRTIANRKGFVMHKLKAIALATALAGASTAAMAAPSVYVGAQLGHQDTAFDVSSSYAGTTYGESLEGLSITGIAGGLYLGTKYPVGDSFFLGTELNVGTSAADHTTRYGVDSIKLEAGTSYGIAALAGMQLSPSTAVYGRLGYQRTEYEMTLSGAGYNESDDETFGGVRVGVGMETGLGDQLALRLDWSQTHYSSKTYSNGWVSETFEPTESLFQVGLSYQF